MPNQNHEWSTSRSLICQALIEEAVDVPPSWLNLRRKIVSMAGALPYYYAPDGKYVLFLDLLGFTSFVRASFQKVAEATDHKECAYEAALDQFKHSQAEVDRAYWRFHAHLESLLRRPTRRGKPPTLSLVFSDCAYVVFDRASDAQNFAIVAMRSFVRS